VEADLQAGLARPFEGALERGTVALGVAVLGRLLPRKEEARRAAAAFGVEHRVDRVVGVSPRPGIHREGESFAQSPPGSMDSRACELARRGPEAAATEEVDVVREGDEKPLAAGIVAALEPEACRDFRHPRPRRLVGRQRPPVPVELRLPLVSEREQGEDLVELCCGNPDGLVEGQPDRVQQRVERVPPLRLH
jgi:hypothetical protein